MEEQLKIKYTAIPIKKDKEDYYVIVSKKEEDFYLSKDEYYYSELHNTIFQCISEREYFEPDREFKIIYQSKQIHKGVPVIDCLWIEDIDKIASEFEEKYCFQVPYDGSTIFYNEEKLKHAKTCFISGYSKAKEKYQFTENDIRIAMEYAEINCRCQTGESKDVIEKGHYKFIQELIKPKSYSIEFETEWNGGRAGDSELILKLNSEGKPTIAKWMEI